MLSFAPEAFTEAFHVDPKMELFREVAGKRESSVLYIETSRATSRARKLQTGLFKEAPLALEQALALVIGFIDVWGKLTCDPFVGIELLLGGRPFLLGCRPSLLYN